MKITDIVCAPDRSHWADMVAKIERLTMERDTARSALMRVKALAEEYDRLSGSAYARVAEDIRAEMAGKG
jgi:hypothetical protein